MFDRFSEHAMKAMKLARDAALELRHGEVRPEHVLLALLRMETSRAAVVLDGFGVDRQRLEQEVLERTTRGELAFDPTRALPFTEPTKRVLEAAMQVAVETGDHADGRIGSEHLLAGVYAWSGVASQALTAAGVGSYRLRSAVWALAERPPPDSAEQPEGDHAVLHVVAGGLAGVDRAALRVAWELRWPTSGWCLPSRRAADGTIPSRVALPELDDAEYAELTRANVRDSDATLALAFGAPRGRTAAAIERCRQLEKPDRAVDLDDDPFDEIAATARWLRHHRVFRLHVTGPHEDEAPGVEARATDFLVAVLLRLRHWRPTDQG